jgi:hypothetical protein
VNAEREALLFALVLGVVIWFGVGRLLAHFGGWRALARVYIHLGALPGTRLRFQSALFGRWVGYNNALTLAAGPRGLGLALSFPFLPTHPRLLIPWTDLTCESVQGRFGAAEVLRFRRAPGVRLTLPQAAAERLREAAGGYWPEA